MADFGDWLQEQAGTVIGKWSDKQFAQHMTPIDTLKQGRLGDTGYYLEGQPGVTKQAGADTSKNTMMLIGGAVALLVLVMVLKD